MSGKPIDEAVRLLREYREAPKFSNDHDAIKRTVALEDEIDAFLAALAAAQQGQAVAECHCATCTCAPGMTPAVRFDTSPAEKEGAIRDHLIALGWTPPGAQQPAAGVGEEIMVNAAHDVYTLPLQPSGLSSGPRFVVHVPAPEQQPAASDSWRDAFVAERARRYRDGGMKIEQARIHAESDADLAIALATQHQEPTT